MPRRRARSGTRCPGPRGVGPRATVGRARGRRSLKGLHVRGCRRRRPARCHRRDRRRTVTPSHSVRTGEGHRQPRGRGTVLAEAERVDLATPGEHLGSAHRGPARDVVDQQLAADRPARLGAGKRETRGWGGPPAPVTVHSVLVGPWRRCTRPWASPPPKVIRSSFRAPGGATEVDRAAARGPCRSGRVGHQRAAASGSPYKDGGVGEHRGPACCCR